jgi:hypothetical protein
MEDIEIIKFIETEILNQKHGLKICGAVETPQEDFVISVLGKRHSGASPYEIIRELYIGKWKVKGFGLGKNDNGDDIFIDKIYEQSALDFIISRRFNQALSRGMIPGNMRHLPYGREYLPEILTKEYCEKWKEVRKWLLLNKEKLSILCKEDKIDGQDNAKSGDDDEIPDKSVLKAKRLFFIKEAFKREDFTLSNPNYRKLYKEYRGKFPNDQIRESGFIQDCKQVKKELKRK